MTARRVEAVEAKTTWVEKKLLSRPHVGRNEGRSSNVGNGSLYAPHSSSNRPRKGGTSRQENCLTSSHARGTKISGMGSRSGSSKRVATVSAFLTVPFEV